jgi:hypothetical protein
MANLTAQPGVPAPAQRVRAVPAARRRSGLPGTLRSEFTKIRSVRSTWLTLAAFLEKLGGSRARGHGNARSTQPQSSSRKPRQRGPSVAVREKADGAHRPS